MADQMRLLEKKSYQKGSLLAYRPVATTNAILGPRKDLSVPLAWAK